MRIGAIEVIDRSVVVEVAATPVTAFIAEADVAEPVVDPAIVADVPAPIPAVEAVAVMPITPVAGGPECTLVRGLNPRARYPIKALGSPGPIAGCPDIVVARSWRLVVVGQGRWWLGCVLCRLLSISGIV
jgi:hypothetical protein